jgi:hypothetical protein
MYAGSSTVRGNPQAIDDAIAYCRDEVTPKAQQTEG